MLKNLNLDFGETHTLRARESRREMGDCKRVAVMEAANAGCCMSKRRRIVDSSETLLPSPSLPDIGDCCLRLNLSENMMHLENSVGTVAGDKSWSSFSKDQFLVSCCSSNDCGEAANDTVNFKDLEEIRSFETVDSTRANGTPRETTPTSKPFEDSHEMDSPATNFSTEKQRPTDRPMKTPPISEIEDFFAEAEKSEQKRFSEKYNFDIVMDVPLEGRYQWIRLKP